MRRIPQILSAAAIALVAASGQAFAQSVSAPPGGIARLNLVSANPIGLLFQWYNGEIEHALNSTMTVAAAGSSFSGVYAENRYTIADGIVRYYPSGSALRAFSVGASVGVVQVRDDVCPNCLNNDSGTAATIGIRGDYVWLLGSDQHFSVATGIGARRVLGKGISQEALGIGRLSIGYAW